MTQQELAELRRMAKYVVRKLHNPALFEDVFHDLILAALEAGPSWTAQKKRATIQKIIRAYLRNAPHKIPHAIQEILCEVSTPWFPRLELEMLLQEIPAWRRGIIRDKVKKILEGTANPSDRYVALRALRRVQQ